MKTEGLAGYICECKVKGVGRKLSQDIVERFGGSTFDIILNDWLRLMEVEGVGCMRAVSLHNAFKEKFGDEVEEERRRRNEQERERSMFYNRLGLSGWFRKAIEEKYGEQHAVGVIKRNPYRLAEDIDGVGFRRADEVAGRLGYGKEDVRRIRAGLKYALQEQMQMAGHCCMPRVMLAAKAAEKRVLDVDIEIVKTEIDAAVEDGLVVEDMEAVYLPKYLEAERFVADALLSLLENRRAQCEAQCEGIMETVIRNAGVDYNEEQLVAIRMAMTERVMILTGGPGTGKTTTLKGMLAALACMGVTVELCAPTGRAAKRMSEMTGEEAKTIHRMLEFQNGKFGRDESNPLEADVIICDEVSMVDLLLMQSLLKAVKTGVRLILIGDNDQLPSVGPGRVLGDLIDSGKVPTVKLTKIHRQQEGSYIIYNAHRIIRGDFPVLDNRNATDFFFDKVEDEEQAAQEVISLVRSRLPAKYPGKEIQVLCPNRKNATGCNMLNVIMQEALNPTGPQTEHHGTIYRTGDRVMQTKNNYQKGVFNGDVGTVVAADGDCIHVMFEDSEEWLKYEEYKDEELFELDLAYATTIHKSQGSEYDIVVVVLMKSASIMLQRNLLYTAVTRAKDVCIIVGQKQAIYTSIAEWRMIPRQTRLKERL